MYKIVGNDGKTYGPVSADQIREWIAQGRVESRTSVLRDDTAGWTFVGLLPEFAPYFADPPPVISRPLISTLPAHRANGFATAGFVCGIISCLCCCCVPLSFLGLIFSIIALVQISAQAEKQQGWTLAIAGLICSAASLLFNAGCGIFHLLTPAGLNWHFGTI